MDDGESTPPGDAVAAAKAYARVAGDGEDALLAGMTATAIALAEAFIGTTLMVRACEQTVPGDGAWHRLATAPVTAIRPPVLAVDGAALAVDRYAADIGADGRGWVRIMAGNGAARVPYVAGLAPDWAGVPVPIAQGVAMLAAHLFAAGEGAVPPMAVSALWRPWRRVRL
jgi:uncharacterized phiE125 gp8 family phage protein